jgi:hypothetical protein
MNEYAKSNLSMVCSVAVFFCVLLFSAQTIQAANEFPEEFPEEPVRWKKSDGGNGHWYQAIYVPDRIAWVEAQLRATARGCGWHLATITTPEEDEFVFSLIADDTKFFKPENPENGPWLGGFQRDSTDEPAGNWRWTTNESFDYTNWGGSEPNNTTGPIIGIPEGSPEDFLIYLESNEWNDAPGTLLLMGYIIERDTPPRHCASSRRKR